MRVQQIPGRDDWIGITVVHETRFITVREAEELHDKLGRMLVKKREAAERKAELEAA